VLHITQTEVIKTKSTSVKQLPYCYILETAKELASKSQMWNFASYHFIIPLPLFLFSSVPYWTSYGVTHQDIRIYNCWFRALIATKPPQRVADFYRCVFFDINFKLTALDTSESINLPTIEIWMAFGENITIKTTITAVRSKYQLYCLVLFYYYVILTNYSKPRMHRFFVKYSSVWN
jgi:hypothetical protein